MRLDGDESASQGVNSSSVMMLCEYSRSMNKQSVVWEEKPKASDVFSSFTVAHVVDARQVTD